MKKKIALMLVGLMCVSATGCGSSKGIDLEAINSEDIFATVAEDAVVDNSDAADAFSAAMNAVDDSENITITVSNGIVLGTEGDSGYQESQSTSVIKLAKDGESQTGSVNIDNVYKTASDEDATVEEEKSKITGYYSGESLYFITNDGDKVVEDMEYDDFLSVVNTYSLSLYNDCISKAACVEEKNDKIYYISYDPSQFETTMNTNMEASGQTLADGEAMHVNYANIIAKIDNDGNLLGYGFLINAEYISDGGTIPYSYTITTDFSNQGSTKVDVVTDTDDYMTADEYTQKMQEEAIAASEDAALEDTGLAEDENSVDDESAAESDESTDESAN